ncbi:hypothetical protein DMA11_11990 [Marinilabiliaceae bacterium JC017]|nr:hypothetical protein DMA11_11990 [Marinilabiliaceae bacterium JC017]
MKTIKTLCLLLALLLTRCTEPQKQEVFKLNYNSTTYVNFNVSNCTDTTEYYFLYNSLFPFDQISDKLIISKDSVYSFCLNVSHPITVHFPDKNHRIALEFFLLPNDTLNIHFNAANNIKLSNAVTYQGKTASISNYLTKGKKYIAPCPRKDETVEDYNSSIDSLTQLKLKALEEYNKKESLPAWYLEHEKTNILYNGANDKMAQFDQRQAFFNQQMTKPDNMIQQLGIPVNNPKARYCDTYFWLLASIRPEKYDTLLFQKRDDDTFFNYTIDNMETLKKYLKKDVMSFFAGVRISGWLSSKFLNDLDNNQLSGYMQKVDSLISYATPLISDTTILNSLLAYKESQLKKVRKRVLLKKGDKAPNFYLRSMDGKTINLNHYKGKKVLINFWGTYCHPCIKSIRKKNMIFQKYNNKNLIMINICLDAQVEKWKELIHKNDFQGRHVICKGNWEKNLRMNYNINTIPHSTLIDEEGLVIANRIKTSESLLNILDQQF